MVKIGNIEIEGKMVLAPMAGVSDSAFRVICREHGASLVFSEMVSAKALVYNDRKTKELLYISDAERPAAAQIFGSDPAIMGEAAVLAREISGAEIIDINMGCPVGKVTKSGDGASLMRDPEKARRIIENVVKNAGVPVTVKMRKGWDSGSVNAVEFARMAEESGAAAVTVHGRTKTQMYSGVADWDIIREVKRSVNIPVLANGDVFSGRDVGRILDYTGADMAMIGRAAFGDPWIFTEGRAYLEGQEVTEQIPLDIRVDTAMRQFEMAAELKGPRIATLEARRHFCWYLRGVPHSGYFKKRIVMAESLEDLRRIAEGIKRELR